MGFADRMNGNVKYVVSTTLAEATWNNSTLIKGDIAEAVSRLKLQPGQDILVGGSARLVQTLMQHGLVDVYRLLVYPIVLGSGKRLFADVGKTALKLTETRAFKSGVALLEYQPAG
ncbi:MAG: dihydrofolate reductase family protein, partial [Dehalococcoidia bacterium]